MDLSLITMFIDDVTHSNQSQHPINSCTDHLGNLWLRSDARAVTGDTHARANQFVPFVLNFLFVWKGFPGGFPRPV